MGTVARKDMTNAPLANFVSPQFVLSKVTRIALTHLHDNPKRLPVHTSCTDRGQQA